jgi:hypothetical protein
MLGGDRDGCIDFGVACASDLAAADFSPSRLSRDGLADAHIAACTGGMEEKAAPAVERQTAVHNCGTAYDVKNALDAGGFPRANALSPTSR